MLERCCGPHFRPNQAENCTTKSLAEAEADPQSDYIVGPRFVLGAAVSFKPLVPHAIGLTVISPQV